MIIDPRGAPVKSISAARSFSLITLSACAGATFAYFLLSLITSH